MLTDHISTTPTFERNEKYRAKTAEKLHSSQFVFGSFEWPVGQYCQIFFSRPWKILPLRLGFLEYPRGIPCCRKRRLKGRTVREEGMRMRVREVQRAGNKAKASSLCILSSGLCIFPGSVSGHHAPAVVGFACRLVGLLGEWNIPVCVSFHRQASPLILCQR